MDNYLKILEESLLKKMSVLDEISEYNAKQAKIFTEGVAELSEFDKYVDDKEVLITRLEQLDEGFDSLYSNVAKELEGKKEEYKPQIQRLQELIRAVTDKSVSVQAEEARNKKLIEDYFDKERKKLGENRKNSKAAYNFYKTMTAQSEIPSGIYDSKN
ncbi:MAG: hypothetical protein IJ608_03090 [Lachnospiraceae bacterium]|nr:hypothetical protein [Lachnospiraceae bacterium]